MNDSVEKQYYFPPETPLAPRETVDYSEWAGAYRKHADWVSTTIGDQPDHEAQRLNGSMEYIHTRKHAADTEATIGTTALENMPPANIPPQENTESQPVPAEKMPKSARAFGRQIGHLSLTHRGSTEVATPDETPSVVVSITKPRGRSRRSAQA